MESPPERWREHHLGPNQPLQGHLQAHTADLPTCLLGEAGSTAVHENVAELELPALLTLQLKVPAVVSPSMARRAQLAAQRQHQK